MLAWGPGWDWVIAANVLLGVNQGLTWSMTVNMKIDLIGPARRGVALGINETAGYLGVAVTALATGYLAAAYGLRPAPELLGAGYALAGLALSVLAVRDTAPWARAEARQHHRQAGPNPPFRQIALLVSWKDRTLAAVSQAGLVNNLNDGLVWVVLPVLLVDHGVSVTGVGYVKAFYPFMWAAGMIATGHLADRIGRKPPIVAGMLIQAVGLAVIAAGIAHALAAGLTGAFLLGTGTALVYPTLLAAVSDATHPDWRASALGIYRFWRDSGYAIGALIGGITATLASLDTAISVAAVLTAASGLLAWAFMRETHPRPVLDPGPSARSMA
jgi:MFS family permease